jgi:Spy/CpxP family protein refolding chaperone
MEKTWQVIAAFVGIFIAGFVTGGLLTMRIGKLLAPVRPMANGNGNGGNFVVDQFAPAQLQMLAQQLELTQEQRETLRPIVLRTGETLRRLRQDTQRETRDILERMHNAIAAVLTPEQLTKFEEIRRRQQQRILQGLQDRKNRPGGQPPGGRPNILRPNAGAEPRGDAGLPPPPPAQPPPDVPGK